MPVVSLQTVGADPRVCPNNGHIFPYIAGRHGGLPLRLDADYAGCATPLPLREGLGGGSFVDVVSQLPADNYNHTHQFKGVIMSIVFVAI